MSNERRTSGPRGGKTTVSKSGNLIRKTFWLHPDEEAALRRAAFEQRRSEAELVREALRRYFNIED
jgi:hypothetical protein